MIEAAGRADAPVDAPHGAFGFESFEEFFRRGPDAVLEERDGFVDFQEALAPFVFQAPAAGEAELSGDEGDAGLAGVEEEEVLLDVASKGVERGEVRVEFESAVACGFVLGFFRPGEGAEVIGVVGGEAGSLELEAVG